MQEHEFDVESSPTTDTKKLRATWSQDLVNPPQINDIQETVVIPHEEFFRLEKYFSFTRYLGDIGGVMVNVHELSMARKASKNVDDTFKQITSDLQRFIGQPYTKNINDQITKMVSKSLSSDNCRVGISSVNRFCRFPKSVVGRRIANGAYLQPKNSIRLRAVASWKRPAEYITISFTIPKTDDKI